MMRNKIIFLDFDGTICEDPQENYPTIGNPIEENVKAIKEEIKNGAEVYLFTLRTGIDLEAALIHCNDLGIELRGYVKGKPFFDELWEDRAKKQCATK